MSPFAFRAIDCQGRRVSGQELATSQAAATQALEARGLVVLELAGSGELGTRSLGFGGIRQREVLEITRSLAALLPADEALASRAIRMEVQRQAVCREGRLVVDSAAVDVGSEVDRLTERRVGRFARARPNV